MPDRLKARLAPQQWSHSESRDVDWAMGAVIGIRTGLWRDLGGYWPLMYASETDLAWRARLRGHRTRFVRESAVMHVGNFSNRQRWSGPEREARVAGSELRFLQAHYSPLRRGLIRAIVACTYAGRAPVLRLLGRSARAREYSAMARVYARGAEAAG
jgi:GT2 family glycosyltransferase